MNFAQSKAFSLEMKTVQFFAINKFHTACRKAFGTPLPLELSSKLISENKKDSTVPQIVGTNKIGLESNARSIFQVMLTESVRRILKNFFTPKFNQFRGLSFLFFVLFLFVFFFLSFAGLPFRQNV